MSRNPSSPETSSRARPWREVAGRPPADRRPAARGRPPRSSGPSGPRRRRESSTASAIRTAPDQDPVARPGGPDRLAEASGTAGAGRTRGQRGTARRPARSAGGDGRGPATSRSGRRPAAAPPCRAGRPGLGVGGGCPDPPGPKRAQASRRPPSAEEPGGHRRPGPEGRRHRRPRGPGRGSGPARPGRPRRLRGRGRRAGAGSTGAGRGRRGRPRRGGSSVDGFDGRRRGDPGGRDATGPRRGRGDPLDARGLAEPRAARLSWGSSSGGRRGDRRPGPGVQGLDDLLGGLVAVLGLLGEHLLDDLDQPGRDVGPDLGESGPGAGGGARRASGRPSRPRTAPCRSGGNRRSPPGRRCRPGCQRRGCSAPARGRGSRPSRAGSGRPGRWSGRRSISWKIRARPRSRSLTVPGAVDQQVARLDVAVDQARTRGRAGAPGPPGGCSGRPAPRPAGRPSGRSASRSPPSTYSMTRKWTLSAWSTS